MFIDPVAFRIGPIAIHWYGIIFAVAAVAAAWVATREAKRRGMDPERVWSMLLVAAIGGIIGARLYHVIHEWDLIYRDNPGLIIQVWNGGLGIPGGVAGGLIALAIYTRVNHLPFWRWIDVGAPALLLAQAIGRFGNFVNQELYGPPISECGNGTFPPCLQWGITIDAEHRAGTPWTDLVAFPPETTQFVPLFAYEMALNLVGVAVLLFVIRRFSPRLFAGDAVLMYIMWYGAVRTCLETYRVNNWTIIGVPTAMWIGIIAFVLAGAWLIIRHRIGRGSPMIRPADEVKADADAPAPPAPPAVEPEASAG
jgi:phosphatidylglycerol:prolipoprotein diacylglycerol transferase